MDLFLLVVALAVLFLLVALISLIYQVTSRVDVIVHEETPLKDLAQQLATLREPYKRPLWTSFSSVIHSFSTLVKLRPDLPYKRTFVRTRNGHELPIDWLEEGIDPDDAEVPLVVVIPGITGHSLSRYLVHLVREINKTGKRVAVLSHPGMGDAELKTPRVIVTYDPSDLEDCINAIHAAYPKAHLQCFAYSLGACLLLNYLGTVGENCPVASAVSVSNPFDIHHCISYLQTYFVGRHVIDRHFIDTYRETFRRYKDLFVSGLGGKIDPEKLENAKTVIEWDLHFSLPAYGFDSIEEYYYVSSCVQNLSKIKIPLLVIHAADDPIAPVTAVPIERLKSNPNIITAITEHGGHCGWVEGLNTLNRPAWVDRVACEWLDTIVKHQVPDRVRDSPPQLPRSNNPNPSQNQNHSSKQKNDNKSTSTTTRKRRSSLGDTLTKS